MKQMKQKRRKCRGSVEEVLVDALRFWLCGETTQNKNFEEETRNESPSSPSSPNRFPPFLFLDVSILRDGSKRNFENNHAGAKLVHVRCSYERQTTVSTLCLVHNEHKDTFQSFRLRVRIRASISLKRERERVALFLLPTGMHESYTQALEPSIPIILVRTRHCPPCHYHAHVCVVLHAMATCHE